ncbi:hypothetical protein BHM03_00013798 [Ensete ventricosum]|nr:hypothetical protein BHM03_00013798 [Ensete ventricosum]
MIFIARFYLSSGKARIARYIPVRQLIGTRTGRYRSKSTVGDRLRKKREEEEKEDEKKRKSTAGDFSPRTGRRNVSLAGREIEVTYQVMLNARIAVSTCTVRYEQYVSNRQLIGMQIARYRGTPSIVVVFDPLQLIGNGRFRQSSDIVGRYQLKEGERRSGRRRGRRKTMSPSPVVPARSVACMGRRNVTYRAVHIGSPGYRYTDRTLPGNTTKIDHWWLIKGEIDRRRSIEGEKGKKKKKKRRKKKKGEEERRRPPFLVSSWKYINF